MKRIACIVAFCSMSLAGFAQTDSIKPFHFLTDEEPKSDYIPVYQYWKEHNIFQHLDVSLTVGTPGIGLEVASPVTDYAQVRVGYEFMPRFKKRMNFDLTIGGKPARKYDEDGNRQETTFDRMSEFLYQFTGYDVDDHVDMMGTPTINNFKFLVDVFPFKENKHWHFTAGFYWGPSQFAYAENALESSVSLVSVGIYNSMYEKAVAGEPLIDLNGTGASFDFPQEISDKIKNFGRLGFSVGTFKNDYYGYYTENVFDETGQLIHKKGEYGLLHKAGELYIVEPDDQAIVRVYAKSNPFKPYVGFGYSGRLLKNRDDWKVSVDCGAMIWGGTPDCYVYDGVNLTKDVENVRGQVGTYVDMFKLFKVYPVLSFRLTKTIF